MAQIDQGLPTSEASTFGLIAKESVFRRRAFAVLKPIGAALFIASIILIAVTIKDRWPDAKAAFRIGVVPIVQSATLYGITLITSSLAWIYAMHSRGASLSLKSGLLINLSAQAGKYLPGNVAHFFARAGLAARVGVRLSDSTIGTVIEVVSTATACALVVAGCWAIGGQSLAVMTSNVEIQGLGWVMIATAVGAAAVGVAVLMRIVSIQPGYLIKSLAAMMTSFVLAGLSFWVIADGMSNGEFLPIDAIAIFAVAWIAGYLVPGAPAGFGIREGILIVWLTPVIGAGEAIACTVMHRLLSAVMDGLIAMFAVALANGFRSRTAR